MGLNDRARTNPRVVSCHWVVASAPSRLDAELAAAPATLAAGGPVGRSAQPTTIVKGMMMERREDRRMRTPEVEGMREHEKTGEQGAVRRPTRPVSRFAPP